MELFEGGIHIPETLLLDFSALGEQAVELGPGSSQES
jgi:hypothetical protein